MPPSSHIASSSSATRRPSLRPRLARKIAAMPAAFASDSSIATNDSDSSVSSSISPPPVQHHTKSFLNTPVQRLLVNDYFRRLYNAPRRYHRFKAISFKTQPSLLDVETNKNSIYFGFFTLFWMVVALLIIKSMHINYLRSHTLLGTHIINILRRDLFKVALVDLCMYLATYFGVFLQLLVKHSLVSWARTGWIIQNAWQTLFLFSFIFLSDRLNLPWIGRVFLLLHSLVLLMKQHSYAFFNGYLWGVKDQVEKIEKTLKFAKEVAADTDPLFSQKDLADITEFKVYLSEELSCSSQTFPHNISLANYFEFSTFPTLVYRMEYPRSKAIRWDYVAEKTIATFGVFLLMIIIAENNLYPYAMEAMALRGMSLDEKIRMYPVILGNLIPPFVLMFLLVFYIIWDAILNGIAELTRFADRGFYGPWWNCVTWDQFARDWNMPVHLFLLQHVYHSTLSVFNVSKRAATIITFLLSSCVHELVMFVIFKKLRGYLLILQMCQLPLVALSRTRFLRDKTILGNVIFWLGIITGPSLMCSLYLTF